MPFQIHPKICRFDTCVEFADAYEIGRGDLMITNEYIYKPFFEPLGLECDVLFQERYGAGEPTDVMIDSMFEDVKGKAIRRVIAVGGGTVLDISKLFALKQGSPILDLFDGKIIPERDKPYIAVPTTCGTGSEVTNLVVVDQTRRGTKAGFGTADMYADDAVLIPELLKTLPLRFFATSSIDAFIHGIESYLSPKATRDSQMFSREAMRLILNGYLRIEKEGADARLAEAENFLTAATYAGVAFGNAGCAAVHAMSYPLGGHYHVPHGEANYAMFRGVFAAYMAKNPNGRIDELNGFLANILGCEKAEVYNVISRLFDNVLPAKPLHEYGMKEEECETFADIVVEKQTRLTNNNYVKFGRDDYVAIYRSLY